MYFAIKYPLAFAYIFEMVEEQLKAEEYDARGITERIFSQLKTDLPLDEFCEEYDVSSEGIKGAIEYALKELGM